MFVDRAASSMASAPGPVGAQDRFLSGSQREVVSALRRGLGRPGCLLVLSGEPGLGKTTLLRSVLAGAAQPVRTLSAPTEQLLVSLAQLRGQGAGAGPDPGHGVLAVDNAHLLRRDTLRGLADALRGPREELPMVVLVAQPSFWSLLSGPALAPLRDRIDVRSVLFPMTYAESELYVHHLFELAGAPWHSVLSAKALHELVLRAGGNPRRLHQELARVLNGRATAPSGAREAAATPIPPAPRMARLGPRLAAAAGGLAVLGLAVAAVLGPFPAPSPPPSPPAPAAATRPEQPAEGRARTSLSTRAAAPDARPAAVPSRPAAAALAPAPAAVAPAPPAVTEARAPVAAAPPVERVPEAPPPARAAAATAPAAAGEALAPELVATLVRRGEEMLALKDVSAAQLLFERAAEAGSASAAMALGGIYDPAERGAAVWEVQTDPSIAKAWYELAATLGAEGAPERLRRLGQVRPAP